MRIDSEMISRLRTGSLGLTGLACVGYAGLALVQGRPDPVWWWLPGGLGLLSALVIALAAFGAGRRAASEAMDELYQAVSHRAQRQAYWLSMAMFVIIAVLTGRDILDARTGFAVLGTLMGASFLLLFVWHDWRMR